MKVFEIATGYTPIPAKMGAATEIVVEELTRSFIKENKDVVIVDIKSKNREKNDLPIIEVNVPSKFTGTDVQLGIMHKLKRVVYSIKLALKLKRIVKESNEKIVLHFHNQYNLFFFIKMTSKKQRQNCFIAYTNHSYIWHEDWNEIKDTIKKRYFQEVASMKEANRVFILNENTKRTLIQHLGIDKNKIQLVNNGVNTEIYKPLFQEEKNKFKEELSLNEKIIFIQIGSVCDRKNQLDSVKLLLPLMKKNKDLVFIYAGGIIDEIYKANIDEFAKKNNIIEQVRYMGEIVPGKELNKYYNLADAMIFPSKSEGFSLVILEAMSAGVPVIINEKLQFELSTQCLKYNSSEDFVNLINQNILNCSNQEVLAKKVRNIVVDNYSWDSIANEYYESW